MSAIVADAQAHPLILDGDDAVDTFAAFDKAALMLVPSARGGNLPRTLVQADRGGSDDSSDTANWDFLDKKQQSNGGGIEAVGVLTGTTLEVFKIASCLGTLDDMRLLEASTRSGGSLSKHLESAIALGIVVYKDEKCQEYQFCNEATRYALYSLIPPQETSRYHLAIGRNLVRHLTQEELENQHRHVLGQFHLGRDSIKSMQEKKAIATLCLRAAELSVSKGNFRLASKYVEFGILLLGRHGWKEDYDLALALYNDAAEVEYSTASFEQVESLVKTILENARCFRDTLRARAARIYALGATYNMMAAVDEGLDVLSRLDETFPANPGKCRVIFQFVRTRRLLKGKSNERILRMPTMSDPDKVAAMQILNLLVPNTYRTNSLLFATIVLRIVQLTIQHGLSPVSAIGFANFASMIIAFSGEVEEGYRYGQLALELMDSFQGHPEFRLKSST